MSRPVAQRTPRTSSISLNGELWAVLGGTAGVAVLLAMTALATRSVFVFLTSDFGHYLADADAIAGDGVRDLRHLPGYPVLVLLLRQVLPQLVAVQVAARAIVAVLFVAGYVLLRRRVTVPVSAALGGIALAGSPPVAEGVAWGAGAMLLGLAFAIVAIHYIDSTLHHGRRRDTALAGVFAALAIATHALPAVVLAASSALVCGPTLVRAFMRSGPHAVLRRAGLLTLVGVAAAVALLLNSGFYRDVEQPTVFDPDLSRLSLAWDWAFRDLWILWIPLLVLGAAAAFDRHAPEAFRRVSRWAVAITAITLVQAVLFGGDPSYTTRGFYMLCLTAAVGAAYASDLALTLRIRGEAQRVIGLSVAVAVLAGTMWSFDHRLRVAVPFYNRVSEAELNAIHWIGGDRPSTVIVTAKGADRDHGTLFSWMIEGVAHARAIGPGRPFLYLLERAELDSADAQRYLAGVRTLEAGAIRVGVDETSSRATVAVRVDGDWLPALHIGGEEDSVARLAGLPAVRRGANGASVISFPLAKGVESVDVVPTRHMRVRYGDSNATGFTVLGGARPLRVGTGDDASRPNDDGTVRVRPVSDQVVLTIDGADRLPAAARTFEDRALVRKQRVSHVLAWNFSSEFAGLSDRLCLEEGYANDEVTVWRVREECR